jgi:hypothetical protein
MVKIELKVKLCIFRYIKINVGCAVSLAQLTEILHYILWISGMTGVRTPAPCVYNAMFLPTKLYSQDIKFIFFFA